MNINGISKQTYYEGGNGAKVNSKNGSRAFHDSLADNIIGKDENVQKNVAYQRTAVSAGAYAYRNVRNADNYEKDIVNVSSVTSCDVRQLSYQNSDFVKAFPTEGYTLAAKVDIANRSVYIECKADDGSIRGYEAAIDKIADNTVNPIEQAALEAWGKKSVENAYGRETAGKNIDEQTMEEALAEFYDFIEDRIKNGDTKFMIGSSEYSLKEWEKFMSVLDKQIDDIVETTKQRAEASKNHYQDVDKAAGLTGEEIEKQALRQWRTEEMDAGVPYGHLAKNGIIEYNGVTFVCDKKYKALRLGDTSDPDKCITIPLSKGGCLILNRNNIADLSKAIGMFSPEDINLIMRAITQDAKIQQMKQQIEEDKSGIGPAEDVEEAQEAVKEAQEVMEGHDDDIGN